MTGVQTCALPICHDGSLGPGHTIVTVLCDGGARYQSRLFNREWLEQKGLAAHVPRPPEHPPVTLEAGLVA